MFSPGSPRIVLQKRKADLPPKNVSAYEAPDPIVSKIINPSLIEGTYLKRTKRTALIMWWGVSNYLFSLFKNVY